MLGVYDKSTKKVKLYRAPAFVISRSVKRLQDLKGAAASGFDFHQARNTLGETFGSRKALKAIKAQERNHVDVHAMEGATQHIQSAIDAGTVALPTPGAYPLFP
jgi:DNA-directed RNA polymerase I subunit RPA49